jgi:molybdenum cofactor biosynthesis enzyme MoaA
MAIRIPLLEIHAAHACNLTCESWSHFSNSGHKGYLKLDDANAWMRSWHDRVVPRVFRLLGGEPTLNPHLPELIELAASHWTSSRIEVTTNGFFLHRHPRLPQVLSRHNVVLRLTVHHQSEEYSTRVGEILALIAEWRNVHQF